MIFDSAAARKQWNENVVVVKEWSLEASVVGARQKHRLVLPQDKSETKKMLEGQPG